MEIEVANLAAEIASQFKASGYHFPESVARFEELLVKALQDKDKQQRLQEIFVESLHMAGRAVGLTQKVVSFLGKYGKYLK